jgi:2-polyprenyl-3-methyl-5-hydroxy-6-metoxy-1,4-benzoquinol methylase
MTIDSDARSGPKSALQSMEVHDVWTQQFRTAENDRFFNLAFDFIKDCFDPPSDARVLDAGCGSGTKSLHLARRGFHVLGLDFSAAILESAARNAEAAGLSHRIEFQQGDLTSINLPASSMRRVVCWGVLMHVPAVEKAVAELSRILTPGGTLVISEGNHRSVQAVALRALKKWLRRERAEIAYTPAGIEFWEQTESGRMVTRQADIPWLISEFGKHGLRLTMRRAGQFSELYVVLPWRWLRRLVHACNHGWFRWIRRGGPAFGNILVFVKTVSS